MRYPNSKIGLWLSIIYLVLTILIYSYAITCFGWFCDISLLAPIAPEALLMGYLDIYVLIHPSHHYAAFVGIFVITLINLFLVYRLGRFIERKKLNGPNPVAPTSDSSKRLLTLTVWFLIVIFAGSIIFYITSHRDYKDPTPIHLFN